MRLYDRLRLRLYDRLRLKLVLRCGFVHQLLQLALEVLAGLLHGEDERILVGVIQDDFTKLDKFARSFSRLLLYLQVVSADLLQIKKVDHERRVGLKGVVIEHLLEQVLL